MKRGSPRNGGSTQAILRHWQKAVPNDRLAHLVRDAAKGLMRALQMRLAEHGVSFGHWTFLRILWEQDGLTQRALSELAGVMEPTTFSALKTLESRGYIQRRQTENNKKNVYIHLTAKGRALKAKLVPLALEVNKIAVAGASATDVAATRQTLLKMIKNLALDEEAAARTVARQKPARRL